MAPPTRRKPAPDPRKAQTFRSPLATSTAEVVDPAWLLKAGAITLLAALFCAWLTLCLLVYQGQWQLVLHPNADAPRLSPTLSLPFQTIHFGATESGQPRLAGWWIPAADPNAPRAQDTILFLHDATGNLETNQAPLEALHTLGLNVFAFDYRGFGASDPAHPNQERMNEDAASALDYLVTTRHLAANTIIPYGAGLGASLAANLALAHPGIPALIVESPNPDVLKYAHGDSRGSLVPLGLMFNQRFEIVSTLDTLKTPKLLLTAGPSPVVTQVDPGILEGIYRKAATPSYIADAHDPSAYTQALTRFLDEYLPTPHP
jgi:pimeloyl-ACP methyl ester carboxylesterase